MPIPKRKRFTVADRGEVLDSARLALGELLAGRDHLDREQVKAAAQKAAMIAVELQKAVDEACDLEEAAAAAERMLMRSETLHAKPQRRKASRKR